jgi:3-deoxy-D-manno-octulosonic acid (KDO) 8-phosphate synthase
MIGFNTFGIMRKVSLDKANLISVKLPYGSGLNELAEISEKIKQEVKWQVDFHDGPVEVEYYLV